MDLTTDILIILSSILASAFFSGMEIAFVSANRLQVELENKQGSIPARITSFFLKHPRKFIGAMLVGNNIALVVYGIYMGGLIMAMLGLDPMANPSIGVLLLQTLISTVVILVTAEFLPKAIFAGMPNQMMNVFAIPMVPVYIVLFLPAVLITGISRAFLSLFLGVRSKTEAAEFGRVDLDHFIREATKRAESEEELDHEIQIFQNALDFSKVKARDCLIPRNELVAVDIDEDIEEVRKMFIDTGLSKILVYRDNIDNIIGYVHSYELFRKPKNIKNILRPVSIVPEPMAANEVLELFIRQKRNIAIVVDEFGGTSGILTMEDIVEEIFGEIEDEHDKEEFAERQVADGIYEFSGRLEIDYINETYKLDLPESEEYDTLAGLVIHHAEDIPAPGTVLEIDDELKVEVLEVNTTRIELVRVFTGE